MTQQIHISTHDERERITRAFRVVSSIVHDDARLIDVFIDDNARCICVVLIRDVEHMIAYID